MKLGSPLTAFLQLRSGRPALIATGAFSAFALGAWFFIVPNSATALPHAIFYSVLVLNTYFSIRLFHHLSTSRRDQQTSNVVLAAAYCLLPVFMGRSPFFELIASLLFALATFKYVLLYRSEKLRIIKRKLQIDLMGCALCVSSFLAALHDHPVAGSWVLSVVFLIGSLYLLYVLYLNEANAS
jgi:hypothetical protein